ncbi:MAG: hypothetical protein A3F84_23280 [Candidatus Handelsmanbacteria bacterium RIFCSPLOWO2_12_FULL_64_10]|uniref:Phosphatidate cytidylyltransferase n=1 Tax=Handelsmanbacteria sp. (strain RIFCSPLOWO2_12_FULL_64_10) TaxID=1817868 RepID=A0A1F6C572_HANXR|nr:MAG: hypothetical protein A3F84_23280 [Candidatus Handelsmanbacteria bacterium RIFCSPLOWO2_12_FULL_64_10]
MPGRFDTASRADSRLGLRLLAAAVIAPIELACAVAGDWWFTGLVLVVAAVAAWEWSALQTRGRFLPVLGVGCALAFPLSLALGILTLAPLALSIAISAGILLLPRSGDAESLTTGALAVVGSICVGCLLVPAIALRGADNGVAWLLTVILGTWACDTLAFAIGRRRGTHRLGLWMSPNKTIEGTISGILAAAVVGVLAGFVFPSVAVKLLGLGVVVGLSTVGGDLVESAVKRRLGVKDMGWIIPGHGGILDRIDGQLYSVLFGYLFVTLTP